MIASPEATYALSTLFSTYTSTYGTSIILTTLHVSFVISPVHPSVLFPVSVSAVVVVIDTSFTNISPLVPTTVPVMTMLPVTHTATSPRDHSLSHTFGDGIDPPKVNPLGYNSLTIASSAVSGPLFP